MFMWKTSGQHILTLEQFHYIGDLLVICLVLDFAVWIQNRLAFLCKASLWLLKEWFIDINSDFLMDAPSKE